MPSETTRLLRDRDCIMPVCPPVVAAVSQPSIDISTAVAGPSFPPDEKFRADPAKTSSSKGKHKLPDKESAVEEAVCRMEMPFHAMRYRSHA